MASINQLAKRFGMTPNEYMAEAGYIRSVALDRAGENPMAHHPRRPAMCWGSFGMNMVDPHRWLHQSGEWLKIAKTMRHCRMYGEAANALAKAGHFRREAMFHMKHTPLKDTFAKYA